MSAPIRIVLRADAGPTTGTGHFARTAAVANALSGPDTEVVLVTGERSAPLVSAYFPSETQVVAVAAPDAGPARTLRMLDERGLAPDVVFLDQYGEVVEWEEQAAGGGARLLVLDDLDAAKAADVIVRPHGGKPDRSPSVVLRGPAYLPLSPHVAALAAREPARRGSRLKLNVCFGGSDPTDETAKALRALAALDGIDADVVIGPSARVDPALMKEAALLPHVALHLAPSQEALAGLLLEADIALGAGGVMLWERLHLGVPSLVVSVADNQRPQIEAMAATGAIRFVGEHAGVTAETIAQAVTECAADASGRRTMAATGRKLVDGRGAIRIAAWLRALALNVRDVDLGDAADLLSWRTHPDNSRHDWDAAAKPEFGEHLAWLQARLADPACVFRLIGLANEPVGVVRFDLAEGGASAHLSIYLVPAWHGRGMGLAVYLAAERALRQSHSGVRSIVSRVNAGNAASVRLHCDAVFKVTPSRERKGWLDARKTVD